MLSSRWLTWLPGFRTGTRWKQAVGAVVYIYLIVALLESLARGKSSDAAEVIALFAIVVAVGYLPAFRGHGLPSPARRGFSLGKRAPEMLAFRYVGAALFPHARFTTTADQLRDPWPELLHNLERRKNTVLFVPCEGNWVSEYATEARVTSTSPLYEFEGVRRVRILKTRPGSTPGRRAMPLLVRLFVPFARFSRRRVRNPFAPETVYFAQYMALDDEGTADVSEGAVRTLRNDFLKWAQTQPNAKLLAQSLDGVTEPSVVIDRASQALFGRAAGPASQLLGANDLGFRLRACRQILTPQDGAGQGGDFTVEAPEQLPTFASVGGMAALKEQIENAVGFVFEHQKAAAEIDVKVNGLLLHGPPGTGKTMIARATAGQYHLRFMSVSGGDVAGKWIGESETKLRSAFRTASANAPCLLFLDEFDSMAGKRGDGGNDEHQKRLVGQLLRSLEEVRAEPGVVVMAATNDLDSLDAAVVRSGRFDYKIRVDLPDAEARRAIFAARLQGLHCSPDIELDELVARTEGRTGSDLATIVEGAKLKALRRAADAGEDTPVIFQADLQGALTDRRGGDRPTLKPVHWDELVLPEETKAQLQRLAEMIANPRPDVKAPSGALLYGPPGTGKTHIAQAIATETGTQVSFLPAKGSDLRSKWLGESAKNVRDLFARARASSPTIVFIDEIEALLPRRSGDEASEFSRESETVVTEFLQQLDGIDSAPGVFVLGATNLPDKLDPAVTRGGRLGRKIEIPLPSLDGREQLLRLHAGKLNLTLDPSVDFAALARTTERFSGADLEALCREAAEETYDDGPARAISQADFVAVLARRRQVAHVETKGWDQLVLPEETLRQLKNLARLISEPDAARSYGIKAPTGALLYGPPGTGKTTIAQVLASELTGQVAFLTARGSDLKGRYVGDSEKHIRDLFERARAQTPAIIFLDEIDALAPRRDAIMEGAGDSLLTEFLQQLDGIDSTSGVFVLGATNFPDKLDPAITRAGRLGRKIEIPLPTLENRAELFRVHSNDMKLDTAIDFAALAARTVGATGSDIEAMCGAAGENAFNRETGPALITQQDFVDVVSSWRPS